jgi:hypothetical protein
VAGRPSAVRRRRYSTLAASAGLSLVILVASAGCGADPSPGRPTSQGVPSLRAFASQMTLLPAGPPAASGKPGVVRFEDVGSHTIVQNAGSSDGFTLFATSITYNVVSPDSSAVTETRNLGPARFASSADAQRWKMAGRPPLPDRRTTTGYEESPAGQFSFMPQGLTFTYGQATNMPVRPAGVIAVVRAHLRPYAGPHASSELVLKQLGFLLAVAPLSRKSRQAAWMTLAGLPGARLCGIGTDILGRPGEGICASVPAEEIKVLVRPSTGQVLAVIERLWQPTPLFPNVRAGTVVGSDAFTAVKI